MLWKRISDGQLFVYHDGQLIFKRWLAAARSVVFNTYGPPQRSGDRSVNLDKKEAE